MIIPWLALWIITGMAWIAAAFAVGYVLFCIGVYVVAGIKLAAFCIKTLFERDTPHAYTKKKPGCHRSI